MPQASGYVFISHSHALLDRSYVERLADALSGLGITVWYDRELASGDRWEDVLRYRMDRCAALVVVVSAASVASPWVRLEVGRARSAGRPILPLSLDGTRWDRLEELQHETVSPDRPSAGFVERLRAAAHDAPVPVDGSQEALPDVIGFYPGHLPSFTGRANLLIELEIGLYWGSSVAVQALHGTGGVGKSVLAAEYVHRRRNDYDLIAWLGAGGGADAVAAGLASLAPHLGVAEATDVAETARAVRSALGTTPQRWLVVYDNAESPRDLHEWLPRSGAGHIIVTSRQTGWQLLGAAVEVDVLSPQEAVVLLRRHHSNVDDDLARQIVEALGWLPLAVEQAAAYLAITGLPAPQYLRLLREYGEQLLDKGYVPGYEHTVATVWEVSRISLGAADPAAEELLRLCAFLAPDPIPLSLFAGYGEHLPEPLSNVLNDEVRFADTVGALVSRSLVRRIGESLTVHRLLAAVIRRPHAEADREATLGLLCELLAEELAGDVERAPRRWPTWRALMPHLIAATRGHHDPVLASMLLTNAGIFLHGVGRLAEALKVSQEAVAIDRELVVLDRRTFLSFLTKSLSNYALRLAQVGQRDEALTTSLEAVATSRELVAIDRTESLPLLAMTTTNHAHWLADLGRRDEALATSVEAIGLNRELTERDRGAFLPDLANSLINHAARLAQAGRSHDALAASTEALAIHRELADTDREAFLPDLAMSLLNYAHMLAASGRREEAMRVSTAAVVAYRELAGGHRDGYLSGLARSVGNHAVRLSEMGRVEEALAASVESTALYRELAEGNRSAFLPDLAIAVTGQAEMLGALTRRDAALTVSVEAVALHRELVAQSREAFLPGLAQALSNHARRLAPLGRADEALAVSGEAVALCQELVAQHRQAFLPDLARAVANHGLWSGTSGHRNEALAMTSAGVAHYRELAAGNPRVFGPELARALMGFAVVRQGFEVDLTAAIEAAREAEALYATVPAAESAAYAKQVEFLRQLITQLEGRASGIG